MTLETHFTIASCTKLLTSISCLQLVEQGRLTLDADIAPHLPELAALPILTGFVKNDAAKNETKQSKERPVTVPRTVPLTLKHLLTHSSGLGYDAFDPPLLRWCAATGKDLSHKNIHKLNTVPKRFNSPLQYEPGTSWGYGCSIDWAGKLVERVSGMTLETYFQKNILDKLDIDHDQITFWLEDKYPQHAQKRTGLTIRKKPGKPVEHMSVQNLFGPMKDCMGGQGLHAVMPAYMKILQSILKDDEKLLKRETTAMMFEPQLGAESKKTLNSLRSTAPEQFQSFVGRMPEGIELDWGLGGMLTCSDDSGVKDGWGRRKGTLMWSGLPNLFWFIDREEDLCGMFATQVIPPGDMPTEDLIVLFEKTMYERHRASKKPSTSAKL